MKSKEFRNIWFLPNFQSHLAAKLCKISKNTCWPKSFAMSQRIDIQIFREKSWSIVPESGKNLFSSFVDLVSDLWPIYENYKIVRHSSLQSNRMTWYMGLWNSLSTQNWDKLDFRINFIAPCYLYGEFFKTSKPPSDKTKTDS